MPENPVAIFINKMSRNTRPRTRATTSISSARTPKATTACWWPPPPPSSNPGHGQAARRQARHYHGFADCVDEFQEWRVCPKRWPRRHGQGVSVVERQNQGNRQVAPRHSRRRRHRLARRQSGQRLHPRRIQIAGGPCAEINNLKIVAAGKEAGRLASAAVG